MLRPNRLVPVLPLVGALALTGQFGSAASAVSAKTPTVTYHAALLDDPANGTIEVRARVDSRRVFVSVHDASVRCDDGSTFIANFENLQGKATRTGSFKIQRYYYGQTGQIYVEIAGRFRRDKADGFFYYLRNSADGFAPDCSTVARVPWSGDRG